MAMVGGPERGLCWLAMRWLVYSGRTLGVSGIEEAAGGPGSLWRGDWWARMAVGHKIAARRHGDQEIEPSTGKATAGLWLKKD
eukprot:g37178.t1